MNILLFVTSMLIVLSVLTYTKMDNFRYNMGVQHEFEHYISTLERATINASAEKWYESIVANSKKSKEDNSNSQASTTPAKNDKPSSPKLSLRIIIDPKAREKDPSAYAIIYQWAKDLIHTLYGQHGFYKEMQEKHPTFVDDILNALPHALQNLPEAQQPKKESDWHNNLLSNLNLGPELKDVYYLMLKGCLQDRSQELNAPTKESEAAQTVDESKEDDSDGVDGTLDSDYNADYSSLLNYVTLNNVNRVRVYLASKPLLIAIFGQPSTADEIIKTRKQLFRAVNGTLSVEDATNQFQSAYQSLAKGNVEAYLDFKVSKTNPSKYD